MLARPDQHARSIATAHCGGADEHGLLDLDFWRAEWSAAAWQRFLGQTADQAEAQRIRHNTHTGRPLGSVDFVQHIERALCRELIPQKGGRPRKCPLDSEQESFDFAITR